MNRRDLLRGIYAIVIGTGVFLTACQGPGSRETAPGERGRDGGESGVRDAEAGCAMCIYHMPGVRECVLAVKLEGRAHLVKGSSIDDHGDAHAADGLCNTARKARVTGRVEGEAFVAEKVELLR